MLDEAKKDGNTSVKFGTSPIHYLSDGVSTSLLGYWMTHSLDRMLKAIAADDAGTFAHAAGLVLDAQAVFGGPRLKRGAIVIEDGLVKSVVVEENPGVVTVSHADEVLKHL